MEMPVGTPGPRPVGLVDGMMREYFTEENGVEYYVIEVRENETWKILAKVLRKDLDEQTD